MKKSLFLSTIIELFVLIMLIWLISSFFKPLVIWKLSLWASFLVKMSITMIFLFGAIWCNEWSSLIQPTHRRGSWNYVVISLVWFLPRNSYTILIYLCSLLGYGLLSLLTWKYLNRYYTALNLSMYSILLFLTSLLKQGYAAELVWQYCALYILGCSVVWLLYFKLGRSFLPHD